MKWSAFQWTMLAIGATVAANTARYLVGTLLFSVAAAICLVVAIFRAVGESRG